MKQRIVWVDIAKGIAIILMIIGHVIPVGSAARNCILSFHMPLFFILTGFTFKETESSFQLLHNIKKDVVHLLVPSCIVLGIREGMSMLTHNNGLGAHIRIYFNKLLWASGVEREGIAPIGAIWFLVSLFWAKIIFSFIQLIIPRKYQWIFYLSSGAIGILLGKHIWLPQSFDISLVAVLFIYIGYLAKKYYNKWKQYQIVITIMAALIWIFCIINGLYIGMANRWYPLGGICILEAVAGCICVFLLAKGLERIKFVSKVMSLIGRHTLLILLAHYVDITTKFISAENIFLLCIVRILWALTMTYIIIKVQRDR